jgi:hypothetical protein
MKMIPWEESFEIKTDLSREAILIILRNALRKDQGDARRAIFRGELTGRGFNIKEAKDYIGGILPLFQGTILETEGGSLIKIRAVNGVSTFGVVFAWSAALVMWYQAFYDVSEAKLATAAALPFLFEGCFYLGMSLFLSLFYICNVRRGALILRRLLDGKNEQGPPL